MNRPVRLDLALCVALLLIWVLAVQFFPWAYIEHGKNAFDWSHTKCFV